MDSKLSLIKILEDSMTKNKEIIVYSNPVTEEINISPPDIIRNVMILNHAGQLVYEGKSDKICLGNFVSGKYAIKIKTDNGVITKWLSIK